MVSLRRLNVPEDNPGYIHGILIGLPARSVSDADPEPIRLSDNELVATVSGNVHA